MNWSIRDAQPGDWPVIAEFNSRLARETESKELDSQLLERGVRRLIGDRALGRYVLADCRSSVIAQLMITYEWSDWRNGTFWWLQSVYVDENWRGRGVFASLYQHVEKLAGEIPDVCGVRLYVEHANARAQAVYRSLGFDNAGYLVLEKLLRR